MRSGARSGDPLLVCPVCDGAEELTLLASAWEAGPESLMKSVTPAGRPAKGAMPGRNLTWYLERKVWRITTNVATTTEIVELRARLTRLLAAARFRPERYA